MVKQIEIIDINAWTGHWGTYPVEGEVDQVRASLHRIGVGRICLSPLDGVWGHNPHVCNQAVYQAARDWDDIEPVPVLDPTIPTWREELGIARECGVRLVKLVPAYSQYGVEGGEDLLGDLEKSGIGVIVQTRIEDQRRQHPLAQVGDFPAGQVAEMARRHPGLTVIVGGPTWSAIMELKEELLEWPRFFADVSQADGMASLALFAEAGLTEKLLFGTHAPLFVPLAGMARVLTELDDTAARAILGGNARRVLENFI